MCTSSYKANNISWKRECEWLQSYTTHSFTEKFLGNATLSGASETGNSELLLCTPTKSAINFEFSDEKTFQTLISNSVNFSPTKLRCAPLQ